VGASPPASDLAVLGLTLGLVLATGFAGVAVSYGSTRRLEAEQGLVQFTDEAVGAQIFLADRHSRTPGRQPRQSERALELRAMSNPHWREGPQVERLSAEKRQTLEETVSGLFLVLARTER
jgi:hypothetical protein